LIFSFNSLLIHGVGYAARSFHVLDIATAPASARMVADDSRNYSQ